MYKRYRSSSDSIREASLAQKVAYQNTEFSEYVGTEPKISLKLANINALANAGYIDLNDPAIILIKEVLNEQRKAYLCTSERFNEVSKLGFLLPKKTQEEDWSEDDDDDEEEE